MVIQPGQQLLHYHLVDKIGEGGMGVVWRAEDTTLDREAAIKVLPDAFADDPDRLARFEREAKLLASLNHHGIASIYGVHESSDTTFLAMELVSGEDLAQRLQRGRLPVDAVLDIARQLAEALEAAHARGVIHRDLKPANIKVPDEGPIKILDFGLAKALTTEAPTEIDPSLSPTLTFTQSVPGMVIGTAAYMSPEQTRGQEVDARSDIWSFGCVLWECLTGETLFGSATASESIGAILHTEPNWDRLPPETPPRLRRLLSRCLAKDPRDRLHHIADARIELSDTDAAFPAETESPRIGGSRSLGRYRVAVGALAISLVTVLSALILFLSEDSPSSIENPLANARFTRITDFEGTEFDAAISPDGKFVAFVSDRVGPFDVWVGQIGSGIVHNRTHGKRPVLIPGIRDVGFTRDGSEIWLAGGRGRRMQFIPLLSGPWRNALGEKVVNAAWTHDGTRLVYHTREQGDPLYVADHNGANRRRILAGEEGVHQHHPIWSTDGQWIYLVRGRPTTGEMHVWRVRPDGTKLERLTEHTTAAAYPTPIDSNTVLYVARERDGAGPWLWVLDVGTGQSRRVSFGLETYTSVAASNDGSRVVATVANPQASLWRVPILDRLATEADAQPYALPTVRALAPRIGGETLFYLSSRGTGDGLWRSRDGEAVELLRGAETPLLEPPAVSPDGNFVAVVLGEDRGPTIHLVTSDGAELRSLSTPVDIRGAISWSPDGEWLVTGGRDPEGYGLFKIPVGGGEPERIVSGEALDPVWSPDGNLIAYAGAQINAITPLLGVRPDGTRVELPHIELLRLGERVRFLPDGSGLVYMHGLRASQDFWLLDLATMETHQLTQLDDSATMRTFDITPDGTEIVFDRLRENSDIVLIELEQPPSPD
jgi:serine/threonine protein kinase